MEHLNNREKVSVDLLNDKSIEIISIHSRNVIKIHNSPGKTVTKTRVSWV